MKKRNIKIALIFFAVFALLFFFLFPYYQLTGKITGHSPLRLIFLNNRFKKTDNRVNILLLGKGDAIHDGPNLTDSIMVASYDLEKKKIFIISLPRDIWSSTLEEKINAAYAFGEAKKKGGGLILAKSEIGAVVKLPIHYGVVIDFDKFKDTINLLGGLDIIVDRSFTDTLYPIKGKENDSCNGDPELACRYKTVSFTKGPHHMDGETALIFVRSRNAPGDEGSDFGRARRQQKVLSALSQKMVALALSGNVKKLEELYIELDRSIERDIENEQAAFLAKSYVLSRNIQIVHIPLGEDLFEIPPVDEYFGKYVLIPVDNDLSRLHEYIRNKMDLL